MPRSVGSGRPIRLIHFGNGRRYWGPSERDSLPRVHPGRWRSTSIATSAQKTFSKHSGRRDAADGDGSRGEVRIGLAKGDRMLDALIRPCPTSMNTENGRFTRFPHARSVWLSGAFDVK